MSADSLSTCSTKEENILTSLYILRMASSLNIWMPQPAVLRQPGVNGFCS